MIRIELPRAADVLADFGLTISDVIRMSSHRRHEKPARAVALSKTKRDYKVWVPPLESELAEFDNNAELISKVSLK